jgi:hypothetical protein
MKRQYLISQKPRSMRYCTPRTAMQLSQQKDRAHRTAVHNLAALGTVPTVYRYIAQQPHPRSRRYNTPCTKCNASHKMLPYTLHSSTYPHSTRYLWYYLRHTSHSSPHPRSRRVCVHTAGGTWHLVPSTYVTHHILAAGGTVHLAHQ